MTRRTSLLLLSFCLLGLAASSASAYVHYKLLHDPSYASFCDISATWSCATVYESRYGAFRGVPVAVGGVIWFAVATLLAAGAVPPHVAPRADERAQGCDGRGDRRP